MVRDRLLDRLRTDEGVRAAPPGWKWPVRLGEPPRRQTLCAETLLAAPRALDDAHTDTLSWSAHVVDGVCGPCAVCASGWSW